MRHTVLGDREVRGISMHNVKLTENGGKVKTEKSSNFHPSRLFSCSAPTEFYYQS